MPVSADAGVSLSLLFAELASKRVIDDIVEVEINMESGPVTGCGTVLGEDLREDSRAVNSLTRVSEVMDGPLQR
jgi:hypothetical protein